MLVYCRSKMVSSTNRPRILFFLCMIILITIWWQTGSTRKFLDTFQKLQNGKAVDRSSHVTPRPARKNEATFHLVTGLMVIRTDSLTNRDRQSEIGMWLTQPYLANVTKTLYHVDYYDKHAVRIVSQRQHKYSNTSWWQSLYTAFFNPDLLSIPNLHLTPLANPSQSQECGLFLQYIVDHYDNLADYSIFLHGGPADHNPHIFEQLRWFLQLHPDRLQRISFLHLNCQEYVQRRYTKAGLLLDLLGFDSSFFTDEGNLTPAQISSGMRYFASQCCAQFIVSSKTIRRHPLVFWQIALKVTLDHREFCIEWEYMLSLIHISEPTRRS